MKKLVFLLAIFFGVGLFSSCEKEQPMLLSEFVLGQWESQEILMDQVEPVYFLVNITESSYQLSLTNGEDVVDLPVANYTVDNDHNTITIDQPTFPDDEPSDEKIPFSVSWVEGSNTMTWTPQSSANDGPPTLIWTKQE